MKTVIINCFDTYEERIDLIRDFFIDQGHAVTVIQSDFRHIKKVHRTDRKKDFIFVKSKPYYKNISVSRLLSHYNFAKDAIKLVKEIKPDLLYVIVPPNSLAKFAAQYKREHDDLKLIFDLMDLWPETMPVGKIKKFPPFNYWRVMRDSSLIFSDFVITECNLYQLVLGNVLNGLKTATVFLAKRDINVISTPILSENEMHLCYLGSINSLIDISMIKSILKSINDIKPTTLHIIGDGESKDLLVSEAEEAGAKVAYYGKIYDPQEKQNIFDRCHFGLNIMKESVCVGLTMKSIDYFQYGVPIINNIQGDTVELVNKFGIGFNILNENIEQFARTVTACDIDGLMRQRQNTREVFEELFSSKSFSSMLERVVANI